jgi:hypothetical protein
LILYNCADISIRTKENWKINYRKL